MYKNLIVNLFIIALAIACLLNGCTNFQIKDSSSNRTSSAVSIPNVMNIENVSQSKIIPYDLMKGDLFYGVCEPLYSRIVSGEVTTDKAVDIISEMGIKILRLWMNFADLLYSPDTPNPDAVKLYKQIIDSCTKHGIVVMGMSNSWSYGGTYLGFPDRNTSADSGYMNFITGTFEKSFETLAKTFPEIDFWQIANEPNGDVILHKVGYYLDTTRVFNLQQKADITTDLMYYCSKGIHSGNPNAKVVMPSSSPYDGVNVGIENGVIESFVEKLYANIRSGEWPSTKTDDFFQIISWHPYNLRKNFTEPVTDQSWVDANNRIYAIFAKNGDGNKPVFITEFGYSDHSDPDKDLQNGQWIQTAMKLTKEKMPYVKVFNVFRLFDDPSAKSWGGNYQVFFGLFHLDGSNIIPKAYGLGYYKQIGGKGNIYIYSK